MFESKIFRTLKKLFKKIAAIDKKVFKTEMKKTSFFFPISKNIEEEVIPKKYIQIQNFNTKLTSTIPEYEAIPQDKASSIGEAIYSILSKLKLNFKTNNKTIEHKEKSTNIILNQNFINLIFSFKKIKNLPRTCLISPK
jgi:hypothetical protein